MKHILALTLALAATTAFANDFAPTVGGVHIASKHSSYSQQWNDNNHGLYARWSNGATVGAFRNSENATSAYVGWSKDWPVVTRVDAGLMLGLVTGYQRAKVLPMVVPSIRIAATKSLGIRTSLIVNPDKSGSHAVHLSADWRF